MRTRLIAYEGTAFNPDHGTDDGAACSRALGMYGGFWGPFLYATAAPTPAYPFTYEGCGRSFDTSLAVSC